MSPFTGGESSTAMKSPFTGGESPEADAIWIIISAFIIFTMQSGFGLLESGMVSRKNEANVIVKNMLDVTLGGVAFWFVGYGLGFGPNNHGTEAMSGAGKYFFWDVIDVDNEAHHYAKLFFSNEFRHYCYHYCIWCGRGACELESIHYLRHHQHGSGLPLPCSLDVGRWMGGSQWGARFCWPRSCPHVRWCCCIRGVGHARTASQEVRR